jgi:hypothetical protein
MSSCSPLANQLCYHMVLLLVFDQALIIKADLADKFDKEDRDEPLPCMTSVWMTRWRREYSISKRLVTLRFKVSKAKLLQRLKTTLVNIIAVRTLWRRLFGDRPLKFISADQKPFWYNGVGCEGTLALKGSKGVTVAENMCATRERWTFMTVAYSWPVTEPPKVACLFKGASGGTIKKRIHSQPHIMVQTQEKGSYRVEDCLEFLDWLLPVAATPADSCVMMLDYYSAHLHESVRELVHGKGHILMYHGGGTTPIEQVNDTHLHAKLSAQYKNMECVDACRQALAFHAVHVCMHMHNTCMRAYIQRRT